eukprot:Hpha_TRINITY_DN30962_c0_g1::TRINITY_DN30962_c0_g1_i1::g.112262::m.112262/K00791/miaA, TRIT1; tRNA dimethylallyltransferase
MTEAKEPCIICVVGATGTGKSQLGIDVSRHVIQQGGKAAVLNCDVMQMFRGLPVATNKALGEEQEGVPHHFLDFLDPVSDAGWTVGDFCSRAIPLIDEMLGRGEVPVVVGGTHYYVQALLFEDMLVSGDGKGST